jgi:hypothetical protein
MEPKITPAELEKQIVELARKYVETQTRKFEKRFTDWPASLRRWRRGSDQYAAFLLCGL